MSLLPGRKRALHKQERVDKDFYTEPRWCSEQLFETVRFVGPIHDPACGEGRIVEAARRAGYQATGSDIADRGYGTSGIDFLKDETPRATLAFNAPFTRNEAFIAHALRQAREAVALIVAIPFVCGQQRYRSLYEPCPPSYLLPLARRPSMPPGGTAIPEKGGTTDFIWLIWSRGPLKRRRHRGIVPNGWWHSPWGTIVEWLPP